MLISREVRLGIIEIGSGGGEWNHVIGPHFFKGEVSVDKVLKLSLGTVHHLDAEQRKKSQPLTQGSAGGFRCSLECLSEICGHKYRVRAASTVLYLLSGNVQRLKVQLL